ncbi:MAG TPA: hypothetical protein VF310_01445 [Vicinamibacteria bacterium]
MTLHDASPDTLALLDLTQANIAPEVGTPAWDAELHYLRDAGEERETPDLAAGGDITEAAALAG